MPHKRTPKSAPKSRRVAVSRREERKAKRYPPTADVLLTLHLIRQFRADFPTVVTQRWLAANIGVDVNTVARWERGELACRWPQMLAHALAALRPLAEAEVAQRVAVALSR